MIGLSIDLGWLSYLLEYDRNAAVAALSSGQASLGWT